MNYTLGARVPAGAMELFYKIFFLSSGFFEAAEVIYDWIAASSRTYDWKIAGLQPAIFSGTPGNFEALKLRGVDLEVEANYRSRLRSRLY